jgi:hypothetical protein
MMGNAGTRRARYLLAVAALLVWNAVYAANAFIKPMAPSDPKCDATRRTWSFVAHWGPLVDLRVPSKPTWIDPATGKPWPTYQVTVPKACRVAHGGTGGCTGFPYCGIVQCAGSDCTVEVSCPITLRGAPVAVVGYGTKSTRVFTGTATNSCKA